MGIIDNELSYALDIASDERSRTIDLDTGYDTKEKLWELIIRHSNDIIWPEYVDSVTTLSGGYSIITISQMDIKKLSELEGIYYIEKPKKLYYDTTIDNVKSVSCITLTNSIASNGGYSGKGILIGIIDSGIYYRHPVFLDENNKTKILYMWDQTSSFLEPPRGYNIGSVYSSDYIDEVLQLDVLSQRKKLPEIDVSGHGTAVAGIASLLAQDAKLLIVKLGQSLNEAYPKTTRLMEAINWINEIAVLNNMPVVINMSFGNNYGAHNGSSLLERYIDYQSQIGRNLIVIGAGNEGDRNLHYHANVKEYEKDYLEAQFNIGYTQQALNIQVWKNYVDDIDFQLVLPDGRVINIENTINNNISNGYISKYGNMTIYAYISEPTPYNDKQEIYIEFIRSEDTPFLEGGLYILRMLVNKVVDGNVDMWMPSGNVIGRETGFLMPSAQTTITVPSTSYSAVSVGAYDSMSFIASSYSGRGFLTNGIIKPDIVAPGDNILAPNNLGGYSLNTGTSMATPIVTAISALMMEWGIINGNDPYMYGQKLKANLIKNANRDLLLATRYPSGQIGWGAACFKV